MFEYIIRLDIDLTLTNIKYMTDQLNCPLPYNHRTITMASKRKLENEKLPVNSGDDFRRSLSSAVSTYESAEKAVLWLMHEYRFDLSLLQQSLRGSFFLSFLMSVYALISSVDEGLKFSFSNVKFRDIAELVGLDHEQKLKDLGTFTLYRSRIPTQLFKSIVEDMDVLLIQYGPLPDQKNEGTRSRFLAPVR